MKNTKMMTGNLNTAKPGNAFRFDTNKCVGCMACVAGCSIENGTLPVLNWRVVNSFNPLKHPDLPVFHFSLACNHCLDAPCMKNCPALAYTRDKTTGAIIHHAEACIGCKYCTWACPYDAPKFNAQTQIVEKCNFCTQRIEDGIKPACVAACPVGALEFESEKGVDYEQHVTPGFVSAGIKPSIHLIPLRSTHTAPVIENSDAVNVSVEQAAKWVPAVHSKVLLRHEWPLAAFTLTVAGLVAWVSSAVTGSSNITSPVWFFLLSVVSIVLASFHIGKKLRLWRFVLNLKGSWLSREIFFYTLFVAFSLTYMFSETYPFGLTVSFNKVVGYIAVMFGVVALIAVDSVYKFFVRADTLWFHSALVSFTAILFFGWITGITSIIATVTLIKMGLYIIRKLQLRKINKGALPLLSLIRLAALVLPAASLVFEFGLSPNLLMIAVLFGEIIDRCEFYYESEVRTPQRELETLAKNY